LQAPHNREHEQTEGANRSTFCLVRRKAGEPMSERTGHHRTDEIIFTDQPAGQEEADCFIDVNVYHIQREQAAPPSVESNGAITITEPPTDEQESADEPEETAPVRERHRRIVPVLIGFLCLLVVGTLAIALALPLLTPTATVTIVPVSKQVRMSSTLTLATGGQPGDTAQIPGRVLSSVTMSQEQSAPTTGKAHEDAQAAHGLVTFYNAAPYAQTIATGTLLTGADGTQVTTDQEVTIPAAILPTEGQATISAHALQTGPAGNISAGDIYGACCRANVFAANGPFTGGQEAHDYQTATQADIDTVARNLTKSLDQSEQAAIQTQVHANETLLSPLPCQETITPDHRPGEEAAQVHVTVSETCTGIVYDTQAYQDEITQALSQQATKQLGAGYSLIGQPQNTIAHVNTQDRQHITLQANIAGTYDYQLSQDQLQQIKTLVAGKSKVQATAAVLRVPGVQSVEINSNQGNLPSDSTHIQVVQILMG
jgi:hypothetical protein